MIALCSRNSPLILLYHSSLTQFSPYPVIQGGVLRESPLVRIGRLYTLRCSAGEVSLLVLDGPQDYAAGVLGKLLYGKSDSKNSISHLRWTLGSERNIVERRQHTRYSVQARVNFKWQDGGILFAGSGRTRDISSNGIFVYSDSAPPEKADIDLDISFHSAANANTNLQMKAAALVIRVEGTESPEGRPGFAVLNRSYRLHD